MPVDDDDGFRSVGPALLAVRAPPRCPSPVEDCPMIGATWQITEQMQAGFAWGCGFTAAIVLIVVLALEEGRRR